MPESNYWWKPDTSTDVVSTGSTSLDAAKFNICRPSFYNATGLNIISNYIADYRL